MRHADVPDVWWQEPEAGGNHPAAGDPHPAAVLLPLLGYLHQHRADPPAHRTGPRGLQVNAGLRDDLYPSSSCGVSVPAADKIFTKSGDHFASGDYGYCSQHPQRGHERHLSVCTEAGHGVSVSRGGGSLSLGEGDCSGLWEGVLGAQFCSPLLSANQPGKKRLGEDMHVQAWLMTQEAAKPCASASFPQLPQGSHGCHQVSCFPTLTPTDVVCNLSVFLPRGSAWANTVSQYTQAILLFLYVWWKKIHVETWGGWTRDCLQDWGSFIHLAVPGMLMMCIEWWTFEIGSFLAGLLSVVELGAQSVIYELSCAAYMVPLGFSVATSVRVGNALGSGDAVQAKTSCITALLCSGVFAVVVATLLGVLKDVVGYIFTSDKEIVTLVSKVMIIFAPFHLFDAAAATCGGVLRGAGKQKMGAIANAIGYYAVGLPIGISLMFAAQLGVLGLWVGMIVCISLQALSFSTFVMRIDWKKAAEEITSPLMQTLWTPWTPWSCPTALWEVRGNLITSSSCRRSLLPPLLLLW
ncbi:multidrug and toxin extrusion protein 2 isoform X2 [Apteryx mantelli]|uniref:Multidrug and toxin extrusion protein n=1 Tax=Apteryx mantelli TaxID=2696672 RepID=A0ABM4FLD2_9AVES